MRIDVRVDFRREIGALDLLARNLRDKAMARALNRTMEQAKTAMSREIRAEFNLSKAAVDQRLAVSRAFAAGGALRLAATLRGTGKRAANVIAFLERSATLAEGRRRRKAEGALPQLRFRIRRIGVKRVIRGAFLGNQGRTVFVRRGKARLPIDPVRTVDVPAMFNARRINDRVVAFLREKFPEILAREARYYLTRR